MFNRTLAVMVLLFAFGFTGQAKAGEKGWTWQIITFGEKHTQIKQTPIIERHYRPLHFYGNTVRRKYYHGTIIPTPRLFVVKIARRQETV